MKIVIKQDDLKRERLTYQEEIPPSMKCRKCKGEAILMAQIHDNEGEVKEQRPKDVRVWPHDALVINIYLCVTCGSMRATWNQG